MLKAVGFQTDEAENGFDALEKAMKADFDLMVVDINMPKMDGFEFCRKIRSSDKYKDVPLLIVSTESEAEDKMAGFKAGANVYLVKPVKAEVLVENVRLLLN
jgi:two-component system chemotaxis response regulator CheY